MQLITMATRTVPQFTTLLLTSLYLLLTIGHAFSDDNSNSKTPTPATPPQGDQGGGGGRGGGSSSHKNLHKILPGADNTSLVIPDIDDYTDPELYALLIDVLEKLGVLTSKTTSCYQLQKIQHKILPPGDDNSDSGSGSANTGSGSNTHSGSGSGSHSGSGSNSIGVFLYFTESPLTDSQTPGDGGNGQATSGQKVTHSSKSNNECVSQPDLIKSMDAQPLVRDAVLNDTLGLKADPPGDGGGGVNGSGEAGAGRHTGKDGGYQITEGAEEEDEKRYSGLSLTQVVVISTCSAIICIFFIVAAILRVRNYIKRQREEQLAATRPTFRSCSVRLRSLSHSNEQVRRDSQVSKLSHQSNLTSRGGQAYSLTNGSTSRDHSNASSPHHDTDTKPLLLLTANTEGLHPMCSPSASQSSSLQFIDEEPRKKRMMAGDDSEATRPLLASTDISANSLLLSPTSSTSGPALSLNGHATHNGGPASLSPNGHALRVGGNLPVSRGNGTAGKGREGPYQQVTDSPSPPHGGGGGGGGVLETAIEASPERRSSSGSNAEGNRRTSSAVAAAGTKRGGSRSSEADRRHSDGETQKGSSPSSSTADRRRSDEDEPQTPADSGDGGNVQVPLIRFCGLTQSDSSLTSQEGGGGRSYQYGTQTEYTPPDLGYFSGTEYINGMNSPYQALQLLQSPLLLGSHLPALSKPADDDCDLSPTRTSPAPGDDITDNPSAVAEREDTCGISKQNSLALSDNACKRLPPSCDNHISNAQSAADSGHDGKASPVVGSKTVSDTDPQNPVTNPSVSEGPHGDCEKLGHPNHSLDSQSKSEWGRSETDNTVCDNTLPKSENVSDSGKTQGGVLSKNGTVPSSSSPGDQTETPSHADKSDPNQPAPASNVTSSSSVKNVPTHHSNQSYDHGSSQPNIANKSRDTQGDQSKVGEYKSRDKHGDQPQYRRKSTPSNTPETEVVMKKLFSFDGERTTFL